MTMRIPTTSTTNQPQTANQPETGNIRLTGFKPTGHLHLGNLLGAIRPIVATSLQAIPASPPTVASSPAANPAAMTLTRSSSWPTCTR